MMNFATSLPNPDHIKLMDQWYFYLAKRKCMHGGGLWLDKRDMEARGRWAYSEDERKEKTMVPLAIERGEMGGMLY